MYSQSTVYLFCNKEIMQKIRVGKATMAMHFNAGTAHTNLVGNVILLEEDICGSNNWALPMCC